MSERISEISFRVQLDENQIPNAIQWRAKDQVSNGDSGRTEIGDAAGEVGDCDAAFLTIWDKNEKNTLRIDLWTKDMMVDDMQIFFHQMMLSMSDTFKRATGDEKLSQEMRDFAMQFGEKMGILRKSDDEGK